MDKYFPDLTGRVVDNAGILQESTKQKIKTMLKNEEDNSSNQIVVVTLKTLHGYPIENFSLDLARHWGIGQKDKDNGVVLLIAKKERKMRIEVGYGLEGKLTDKISHEIMTYTLTPAFKKGDFNGGVLKAVKEILQAVNGEYVLKNSSLDNKGSLIFIVFSLGFAIMVLGGIFKNELFHRIGFSAFVSAFLFPGLYEIFNFSINFSLFALVVIFIILFLVTKNMKLTSSNSSSEFIGGGGSSFGGSFGGGFSGGGGSFGGGGASGGW